MNDLQKIFFSTEFWIVTFSLNLFLNVIGTFISDYIKIYFGKFSEKRRKQNEADKLRFTKTVEELKFNDLKMIKYLIRRNYEALYIIFGLLSAVLMFTLFSLIALTQELEEFVKLLAITPLLIIIFSIQFRLISNVKILRKMNSILREVRIAELIETADNDMKKENNSTIIGKE